MYLLGEFDPRKYVRVNRNARQEMAPPRLGRFDEEGYRLSSIDVALGVDINIYFDVDINIDIGMTGAIEICRRFCCC